MAACAVGHVCFAISRRNAMEAALKCSQPFCRQVVFLNKFLVVVALSASECHLRGIDLRAFIQWGLDLMLAMAVDANRHVANTFNKILTMHAFKIVFENAGVTHSAGVGYLPSRHRRCRV